MRLLLEQGPTAFKDRIRQSLTYHLDNKWHFVYLQFELRDHFTGIPMSDSLAIRIAGMEDIEQIRVQLFPEMKGEQVHEKKYFDRLNRRDVRCFIAERDGKLVHYSWVFLDAGASPLAAVPFDRRKLRPGDVYIGPVFTAPGARGFIYPQVLAEIIRHLKSDPSAARLLLLVYGRNPPAVSFYKRLGFLEIDNPEPRRVWSALRKRFVHWLGLETSAQ